MWIKLKRPQVVDSEGGGEVIRRPPIPLAHDFSRIYEYLLLLLSLESVALRVRFSLTLIT